MTQILLKPFSLKIMAGNPNFKDIVEKAREFGCQQGILVPWIDPLKGEKPRSYIQRVLKNTTCSDDVITLVYIVICGQRILPIPESLEAKSNLLKLLSGRRHQIWIGLACQIKSQIKTRITLTRVSLKNLSTHEMTDYISSDEGNNCSGGYHPNGYAARFVKSINGSPSALTGLPAFEFHTLISTWRAS
ncbi:MAG: Maf family protein [Janthinobacterium lividum]